MPYEEERDFQIVRKKQTTPDIITSRLQGKYAPRVKTTLPWLMQLRTSETPLIYAWDNYDPGQSKGHIV